MGGYLAALYASAHPERVESLFCISPAGMEPYDAETYDPFKYPDFDKPEKPMHATIVEGIIKSEE